MIWGFKWDKLAPCWFVNIVNFSDNLDHSQINSCFWSPVYLGNFVLNWLTNVEGPLIDGDPLSELVVVEVRLDVRHLDVRLVRIQLAHVNVLGVLDDDQVILAVLFAVERLQ